jgi:fibronectin-binding autotransporter adhesin
MKNPLNQPKAKAFFSTAITGLLLLNFPASRAQAANDIWTGGGADGKWQTPDNWGGTPPSSGDALTFQGTARLNNTNNFTVNTPFNGITFNNPAGAFNLFGSQITLANDIVDNQVVVNQSVNLPLSLDATHNLNVITSGLLTINGAISGAAGAGITLPGGGRVTLTATNTFTGPVTINNGTLFVSSDFNLGAVPAATTPGAIVINNGILRTGSTFTNNVKRGIRLGPVGGSGSGTIQIDNPAILTYSGVIADNTGGSGGLTKSGFGGLTLGGANTYSGPTLDEVGTITLNFTQTNAPGTNIINPVSSLTLGGANAGFGAVNFAALVMNGKTNTASLQTVNGTLVTFGGSVIQARSLGASGAANLNLGLLTHNPGGTLVVVPPVLTGGHGNINTTATNVNGILGGFATVSDGTTVLGIVIGTNFACVDASGNITNYNGYQSLANGQNIHTISAAGTNVLITSAVTGDMVVDDDNANSVTDVNAINWNRTDNLVTLKIGIGNTLRLGRYGSIFKPNTTSGLTWLIGETAAGANGADQNVGTLTAGGADNTDGEIIINANNTSSSSGTVIIDSQITDNGTGKVTFIKAGVGSMKLRGHNTYSGGTYLLQGRVQMVGGEGGVGTGNADACGTGPIYILPGAYLFPSGTAPTTSVTNAVFIAGNGTAGEPLGAIRCTSGWLFNGPWTLIGDTTLGGNGGASGAIGAKLSGPFNLSLCSPVTVNGTVCLTNSANDWDGTTTLNARNNTGANVFLSGNSEIIPNGFGKGSVVMNGFGTGTITWNLNGFSETINGLITSGTASTCTIVNNSATATASTLTLGDNDQSGAFGGAIQDGTGTVALTKIGAGIETLSGTVTYSGNTTVNGGTLVLISIAGALSSSAIQVNSGAVLDVSGVSGGSIGSSTGIGINGGRLIANASGSSINNLSVTNADLQVVLNPATVNIQGVTTLTTGGTTNLLDISSIQNVAAYPVQFTVIKYTGSIAGSGFNFGLGTLPTINTVGYVSNNVDNSSVNIVLFNGPKLLNWTASVNTNWDITGTQNWKFGATLVVYNDQDTPNFDDTASSGLVNLTTIVTPGIITVSNNVLNYVFTGNGKITGFASLNKLGTGTLTITNTGVDNYSGGVVISGGGTLTIGTSNNISGGIAINSSTLQITAGNLPSGNIVNEGTLLFNATSDISADNSISGDSSGVIIKTNTDTVTLGGASTHNGTIIVAQGTLKAGSGGAFGNGSTVIVTNNVTTSATLDVNGQTLQTAVGPSTVVVNGTGVGGNGAILNSGPDSQTALLNVTLAGDTTFGGSSGRWDIRTITGFPAQLQTGGQPYNLTKVGTNQVSLVGVNVDSALGNIVVQNGLLSIETSTTSLGDNTSHNLTVAAGATLQLFNYTSALNKPLVLNGNGVTTTLNNGAGTNTTDTSILLNSGNCVFNVAGTSLTISDLGTVGYRLVGPGGLIKSGGSPLYINIPLAYAGATLVTNGTLVVNAPETNSSSITVGGGTLAGTGSFASPVMVGANGTLSPGDTNAGIPVVTLVISNSLSLAGTCAMDVTKSAGVFSDDVITNVTALTLGGKLQLDIQGDPLTVGDIIPLFSFNSASGSFVSIVPSTPATGLAWDTSHLSTDGTLRVITVSTTPTSITAVVSGNQLTLSWPADHIGWRLQVQTNSISTGLSSNWVDVPGSTLVNSVSMTIDPANGAVFFRMVYP